MKRKMMVAIAALAAGALASTTPARAGGTPAQKCAGGKLKGVSKAEGGKLGCYSKAAAKALAVDPACLSKADTGLAASFTKADPGDGANPGGTCEGVESSVLFAINHCVDLLNGQGGNGGFITDTGKCAGAKFKAAGKNAGGKAKCWAGAIAKGLPTGGPTPDPKFTACIAKANTSLAAAFSKADGTAPCSGTVAEVTGVVDTNCVQGVVSQIPALVPGCGNGFLDTGETCDDGNTTNGDACPASCVIQSCTVNNATHQTVSLHLTTPAGVTVGGLTLLLDYPEGNVRLPHTTPGAGVLDTPNDLTYELKDALIDSTLLDGIPANGAGAMLTVAFNGCMGQPLPVATAYTCTIIDASDENGITITPLSSLSCSVTIP